MEEKIRLFLDFDGVIVNTIRAIVDMYKEDFCAYSDYEDIDWSEINSWEFTELKAATPEYINHYFNQPRFFEKVQWMPWARETIDKLKDICDITIVSSGFSPNLRLKEKWVKDNMSYADFIGVNFKQNKDKSSVDMSGGIFIDDCFSNLSTSNASICVCFGDVYPWNEQWNGIRCANWCDVWKMFKERDNARV